MHDNSEGGPLNAAAPSASPGDLVLTINNAEMLRGSTRFTHTFGGDGGTIGSGDDSSWTLTEGPNGKTEPCHAQIQVVEGAYCLIDKSNVGTFLNGSSTRCQPGTPVRLNRGDKIGIGDLEISVDVTMNADDPFMQSARNAGSLDGVTGSNPYRSVAPGSAPKHPIRHNPLLEGGNPRDVENPRPEPQEQSKTHSFDPLTAFADSKSEMRLERDPLALFDRAEVAPEPRRNQNEFLSTETGAGVGPAGAEAAPNPRDLTGSIHAAVSDLTPGAIDNDAMNYLASLENQSGDFAASRHGHNAEEPAAIDHVVLRPLLKAMGLDVTSMDAAQAEQFLTEVGLVLRETVSAMVDLYADAPGSGPVESRLNAACVLPLEDNPMRLAQSVDEGMENLFFIQNPVQLSPSDAIRECFGQIKDHQKFTEGAADQGLQSALKVFDPSVLSQRFHSYAQARRDPRPRDAAWHWDMYQKYYAELSAKRQDGLRRIFWQVFERAYDQSVRNQPSVF